jgi:hypothetical protein
MKMTLKSLGYGKLTAVDRHGAGLVRITGRSAQQGYSLVLFDAKPSDISPHQFVQAALNHDPEMVLIAATMEPRIDDVFGLLKLGARSFLAIPFTAEILEQVLDQAKKGPPFSESVLMAPDRNAALVGLVLNNLYKLSVCMRQAREFHSAKERVDHYRFEFNSAMEMARLFCENGDVEKLVEYTCEQCLDRGERAASRLGRARLKLQKKRAQKISKTTS